MKPPTDRPTPREPADSIQVRLAEMNVPESLAFVLKTIRADVDSIKTQNNLAMGELHKRLEDWRSDLMASTQRLIEEALRAHVAEHHMNGDHS